MKNKANEQRGAAADPHSPSGRMQILKETPGDIHTADSTFDCIECRKPISSKPYSFGGGALACESCVRAYYKGYPETSIAEELRCRGNDALRIIKQLSKRYRKPVAPRFTHMCDVCAGNHSTENCPDDF
ncbi:MAG TPA: hypothetical protein VNZ03_20730 [Terriglobales bacterium]|jgi:hypothetical protein|nr:hypothetical protein [Terriglobales bacterium]